MGGGTVELTFKSHRNDIEELSLIGSRRRASRHAWPRAPRAATAPSPTGAPWYSARRERLVSLPPRLRGRGRAGLSDPRRASATTSRPRRAGSPSPPDRFPPFRTPDWVKDAVIYQIFPDRFRNGDPANDPDFTEWYYEGKNALPASGKTNEEYFHLGQRLVRRGRAHQSPYRTDGKPDYFSFYGGDIEGVRQELGLPGRPRA